MDTKEQTTQEEELELGEPTKDSEGNVNWEERAKQLEETLNKGKERQKSAKAAYEKQIAELKEQTKLQEKPQEKPQIQAQPDTELLKKDVEELALQVAGIVEDDEVELFSKWKESTGREPKNIVNNDIFKAELQKVRDDKANAKASSNIKGGGGGDETKSKPEYWIEKGTPPTAEDVPDRKVRAQIINAMLKNSATQGKTYWNE